MADALLWSSPYAPLSGRVSWRTADGCTLVLRMGARPGWGGTAPHRAVRPWRFRERRRLAALGRMLKGARRVGRLRRRGGARTLYLVFRGRYGRRAWDVVARPTGRCRADIVAVRRAGALQPWPRRRRPPRRFRRRELEAETGGGRPRGRAPGSAAPGKARLVRIRWLPPCDIRRPCPIVDQSAIYMITVDGRPTYAGLTGKGDRFEGYRQYAPGLGIPVERVGARVGIIESAGGFTPTEVETLMIRTGLNLKLPLGNRKQHTPRVFAPTHVVVLHTGEVPDFLRPGAAQTFTDSGGRTVGHHRVTRQGAVTTVLPGAVYELPEPAGA